jgi:hypothetical protein
MKKLILSENQIKYLKYKIKSLINIFNIQISHPKQLLLEWIFALENSNFNNIFFIHKVNIINKLTKNNQWRSPYGFYKSYYYKKYIIYNKNNKQNKSQLLDYLNKTNTCNNTNTVNDNLDTKIENLKNSIIKSTNCEKLILHEILQKYENLLINKNS